MKYELTRHAKNRQRLYKLSDRQLRDIIESPDEEWNDDFEHQVFAKTINKKRFLVFSDTKGEELTVITIIPKSKKGVK